MIQEVRLILRFSGSNHIVHPDVNRIGAVVEHDAKYQMGMGGSRFVISRT
jgi:hypothetical protein